MFKEINKLSPFFTIKDKLYYVLLFFLMIIGALFDVLGVGVVPAFVATLAAPEMITENQYLGPFIQKFGITDNLELVRWGCLILIIAFILKNGYLSLLRYFQIRLTEFHWVKLSHRLFNSYMAAPYEFHVSKNKAELLRNVYSETKEIFTGVINPLLNMILGLMLSSGIILLLIITTPSVAILGILVVGGGSWAILRVIKNRLKYYGVEAKKERKETIKSVNQGMEAVIDAHVLEREKYFVSIFKNSVARLARFDRLRLFINKSSTYILETISVIGLLVILLFLLDRYNVQELVPIMALFGTAVIRLRASLGQIVSGVSMIQYGLASIPNVVDDLHLLSEEHKVLIQKNRSKIVKPLVFKDNLIISDLSYYYPGSEEPALENINIEIKAGSSVAFIGSTGSGKTTLVNIILGLLHPSKGDVLVDGKSIFENISGWRSKIGYIPQQIYLLDDSIASNIAFGLEKDQIDYDKLNHAIEASQLNEFVESLEKGVHTIVGERGSRISGGQRQRIGMARALYNNPDVLIMDEATSALDNRTENLVMEALMHLKEDRTFIMIAHRLSTVQSCDQLHLLKNGKLSARGTFDELSEHSNEFRDMALVE